MKTVRQTLVLAMSLLLWLQTVPPARACGLDYLQPVFVFRDSGDLPFSDFTAGKIGIVQPTFGKKTLAIAYRYLNGSSFSPDEQKELVVALKGEPPEDDDDKAIKAWIEARREVVGKDERLPEIYAERKNGGYDFFPNCARNGFEVAIETLKDRVAKYGADDRNVRDWLAEQDLVFQNCSGGSTIPPEPGAELAGWLRKDRQYQIAAAYFYSLNFDKARAKFAEIAADVESPWRETADYLIARTLVRQASLTNDKAKQLETYSRAEDHLKILLARNSSFNRAQRRLLGLVKYRVRPEERVRELAQTLAGRGWDDNLKQNLIDYSWLLDKFQAQVEEEEQRREEEASGKKPETTTTEPQAMLDRRQAIARGELLEIWFYPSKPDGEPDYSNRPELDIKYDVSLAEVQQIVEAKLGRQLAKNEYEDLKEKYEEAQSHRLWLMSPNRKWGDAATDHAGCNDCSKTPLHKLPEFLRSDDLSDWILATQTSEPAGYAHAFKNWQATDSRAWLVTALSKASRSSRQLERLLRAGEKVQRDEPAFASVAYHLVRLKIATGNVIEARKLVDEIISWQADVLPVSAQNQFLEQRLQLAANVTEYLKFAQRKPVTFYEYGRLGSISELLGVAKSFFETESFDQSKEQYDRELDNTFKELLPWEDRLIFSEGTIEVLNWHFPTATLFEMTRSPVLPEYLRREVVLAVWTRAVVLGNDTIALRIAPEVMKVAPDFSSYLEARTKLERDRAALFVLLKNQSLSLFIKDGIPTSSSTAQVDYYLETSWWCAPESTQYDDDGNQSPRVVTKPGFLTAQEAEVGRRERARLIEIGDAKSYLGRRVLEWAKATPGDKRLPEALFIAVKANESYKYGCGSWDHDEDTRDAAEAVLRQRYPSSPWTARLKEPEK
jgi:hypothetical protein